MSAKRTVTYQIVSSSFPNWEGEAQTRSIDKLTAEQFVNTDPNVAGGRGSGGQFFQEGEVGGRRGDNIATGDGFRKGSTHPTSCHDVLSATM